MVRTPRTEIAAPVTSIQDPPTPEKYRTPAGIEARSIEQRMPLERLMSGSLYATLTYDDAAEAIDFLVRAFGFEKMLVVPGEGNSIQHAELRFGDSGIMLGSSRNDLGGVSSPNSLGGSTFGPYGVVDDPDAHYARAKAAGAEIVRELRNEDYGSRGYSARDPGGYVWSFGTYRPAHESAGEA